MCRDAPALLGAPPHRGDRWEKKVPFDDLRDVEK
jgi:hypothetical protein